MIASPRFLGFIKEGHIYHIFAYFDGILRTRTKMSIKYSQELNFSPSSMNALENADFEHRNFLIFLGKQLMNFIIDKITISGPRKTRTIKNFLYFQMKTM